MGDAIRRFIAHLSRGAVIGIILLGLAGPAPATAQAPAEGSVYLPLVYGAAPAGTSAWLSILNGYRALADLPPVSEDPALNLGTYNHARYMVKNNRIEHSEDPGNEWYTTEGATAARSSNLMVHSDVAAPDEAAFDLWIRGPFHALGLINPWLLRAGYGSYREALWASGWNMGAALNVTSGQGSVPAAVQFPVFWPRDGASVALTRFDGNEWPDPLSSCPGYQAPVGLPVIVQLGVGGAAPNVTAWSFRQGDTPLESCLLTETNYENAADKDAGSTGRQILADQDAIVIVPRRVFETGKTYTASVTVSGQVLSWSFNITGD